MILHRRHFRLAQFLSICFFLSALPLAAMATEEDAGALQGFFDGKVGIGYKAVSTRDEPGRADEYSYQHSSPVGTINTHGWKDMRSFSLLADYRNEADYRGELELNHRGQVRFWLTTESMFHNLDHLPFDDVNRPDATKTGAGSPWVTFEDLSPGDEYFVEVEQNRAHLRAKPGNYPAHLNLEYWRLERSGRKQLRFLDHGAGTGPDGPSSSCNECHVRSQSRTLDQVTEEVKGSVDAHLGYADVIFEQLYREFRDREPVPLDDFGNLVTTFGGFRIFRNSNGPWHHDEDPDSRLVSSTLKVHTALSGGVVGAASFTIGKRENQSDLSDVQGVKSETDFRKGTADVTWISSPRWTVNLRYRLLDMDNSNSSTVFNPSAGAAGEVIAVRDNVDLTRATYAASVAFRPTRLWTVKGDFEHKKIHRGNAGEDSTDVWKLPKDEDINRLRVTLLGRLFGGNRLKLQSWYEFLTSDDPAYGASAEESHQAFLGATWTPTPRFGLNTSVRLLHQNNKNKSIFFEDDEFEEDRRHEKTNIVAGCWWNPVDALGINLNYGYLRTRTLQDLIFSTGAPNYFVQDDDLENSQRVHTASVGVNWRILDVLRARIEGRYIDSYAVWDPRFALDAPTGTPVDSSALKDASRLDIRQAGASLGLDWSPKTEWTCSALYTYDDYEDRDTSVFDGSVQTYMASVSRSW